MTTAPKTIRRRKGWPKWAKYYFLLSNGVGLLISGKAATVYKKACLPVPTTAMRRIIDTKRIVRGKRGKP